VVAGRPRLNLALPQLTLAHLLPCTSGGGVIFGLTFPSCARARASASTSAEGTASPGRRLRYRLTTLRSSSGANTEGSPILAPSTIMSAPLASAKNCTKCVGETSTRVMRVRLSLSAAAGGTTVEAPFCASGVDGSALTAQAAVAIRIEADRSLKFFIIPPRFHSICFPSAIPTKAPVPGGATVPQFAAFDKAARSRRAPTQRRMADDGPEPEPNML
jgi:hypothetical protein